MSRIADLPRRKWRDIEAEAVECLTAMLKTPNGRQVLRGLQAVGLWELLELGGVFVMGRVGVGKTLISLLAGELLEEPRILILIPGGAKTDTDVAFTEYRKHWKGPGALQLKVMGYGDVSTMPRQGLGIHMLWGGKGPTIIICDEADKLRRVAESGLALQVNDWLAANPDCKLVALTATPLKCSVLDFAHILQWCLRDGSPMPVDPLDLAAWSEVIDKGNMLYAEQVCKELGIPLDSQLKAIREAFRERLHSTPGIIVSDDRFEGALTIAEHIVEAPAMAPHWTKLRDFWQRADDWDLSPDMPGADERKPDRVSAGNIWSVAQQYALGFCYVPSVRPPEDWLDRRKAYFKAVRKNIGAGKFYTQKQFDQACVLGKVSAGSLEAYARWKEVEASFTPASKPLWLDDTPAQWCIEWGTAAPGIIWVDHIAFGERLSALSGWSYYAGGGKDKAGRHIARAPGNVSCIASRAANGVQKHLVQFNRMLFTRMVTTNRDFEQNLGREHREGQTRPVHADILVGCIEHLDSIQKTIHLAQTTEENIMLQKATVAPWQHINPQAIPKTKAFRP